MAKPGVVKQDIPFRSDDEIRDLVVRFERCVWPYERWTHRAHLALALSYLRQYPLDDATNRGFAAAFKRTTAPAATPTATTRR